MAQFASGATSSDITGATNTTMWLTPSFWEDFVGMVAKPPSIVSWYQDWGTVGRKEWDATKIARFTARGETPNINWAVRDRSQTAANDTVYTHANVLAGNFDAYIDEWGADMAAWGKPILLTFGWEMNLTTFTWGIGVHSQTAATFVQFWQYIVNRVRAQGASNVSFMWIPHASGSTTTITDAYPGDAYVDYVGLDNFNGMGTDVFSSPSTLFQSYYDHITQNVTTTKPFCIKETGSMEEFGDKAQWITDLFDMYQNNMPRARILLWFNFNNTSSGERDWRVNTTTTSLDSYNTAISRVTAQGQVEQGVQLRDRAEATAATGTSITVAKPSSATLNDVAIAMIGKGQFDDTDTPTGWTKFLTTTDFNTNTTGNLRYSLFWKRIDGTEGTSWTWNNSAGVTATWDAQILLYKNCALDGTPVEGGAINGFDGGIIAGATISCPTVTPTSTGRRAVGTILARHASATPLNAGFTWASRFNETAEVNHSVASTNATTLGSSETYQVDGTDTSIIPSATITNAQTRYIAASFALIPEVGFVADTETMRPTATTLVTNLTPSTDPAAVTAIQDDPDTADSSWLTGTDPSGTSGSLTNQYAASVDAATPTGFTAQLTSPTNAVGSTTGTYATSTMATRNVDYGNLYLYGTAFSTIPDTATITALSIETNRFADASTGITEGYGIMSGGALVGAEVAGTLADTTATTLTTNITDALPTVAQVKAATFGVRVRARRTVTQARTYSLDWVRVNVTYQSPGSTTPITVRVQMGSPTGSLLTGTATGQVRARVRKLGTGTSPSVSIAVVEGGSTDSSPIQSQLVSDSSTAGVVISGSFDQSNISNPDNVELWVTSSGQPGGMVELGALEWVADVVPPRSRVIPDSILAQSGYTSPVVSAIQDDPDSPDATWIT